MERFKQFSLIASSLMLVLALVTVLGSKPVHALVASMVMVVNNASNPIPVTGSVGITGTPNVHVTNPLLVGIDSLNNTVKIDAASPVPVRDVDNPARQPYFFACVGPFDIPDYAPSVRFCQISVPIGKRLVIENVSGRITVAPGQKIEARLEVHAPGGVALGSESPSLVVSYPAVLQRSSGSYDAYALNQTVRIYADHRQGFSVDVAMTITRDATVGSGWVSMNIIGYLVSL